MHRKCYQQICALNETKHTATQRYMNDSKKKAVGNKTKKIIHEQKVKLEEYTTKNSIVLNRIEVISLVPLHGYAHMLPFIGMLCLFSCHCCCCFFFCFNFMFNSNHGVYWMVKGKKKNNIFFMFGKFVYKCVYFFFASSIEKVNNFFI